MFSYGIRGPVSGLIEGIKIIIEDSLRRQRPSPAFTRYNEPYLKYQDTVRLQRTLSLTDRTIDFFKAVKFFFRIIRCVFSSLILSKWEPKRNRKLDLLR